MKVVIATPFHVPGDGVLGHYAVGISEALRRRGDTCEIVAMKPLRWLPPGVRHFVFFCDMFLKLGGASYVLALDTWSVGLPAFIAARLRGKKFAWRIGGDFLWEKYLERTKEPIPLSRFYERAVRKTIVEKLIFTLTRFVLRHADANIFTTRFQRDIWSAAYDLAVSQSCIVANYFPPKNAPVPRKEYVFVSAGRPIALKNVALVEKVFAHVKARYPHAQLDMRTLPRTEHQDRVRSARAVIIPSFSEVCSNTAIEAVSLGTPFIMTRDTGTSEFLPNAGIYTDTLSEDALVNAILGTLDEASYATLLQSGEEEYRARSWDDIVAEIQRHVAHT